MNQAGLNKAINKTIIILLILLAIGLLYLLEPILMPFLAGALLAYLTDPLVNKLMYLGIKRIYAVVSVFFLLFLSIIIIILLLVPLIQHQITNLIVLVPETVLWLQNKAIVWLTGHLPEEANFLNTVRELLSENLVKAGSMISWVLRTMLNSGKALFETIMNVVLIPVVTFYLLRDWNVIIHNLKTSFPRDMRPTVIKLTKECDTVLSAFFRGQFLVMLSLGIYYACALSLMGLQIGIILGLLIGLVSIVPYLGLIVGILLAIVAALVQFGTITSIIWVLAIFAIGSILENIFLVPNLIGDRIGLHPVAVIFAILAGGTLFGFFGILLALPAAAVIMVLLRHLYSRLQASYG